MTRTLVPEHLVAEKNVDVPTLVMAPVGECKRMIPCVQWTGKADMLTDPDIKLQFFFSFMIKETLFTHESDIRDWRVVFLGQVKDWPNQNAIQDMAKSVGGDSPETWIIWAMNPKKAYFGQDTPIPHSVCFTISLLGDPTVGIITPELYSDLRVRDEVMKMFAAEEQFNAESRT